MANRRLSSFILASLLAAVTAALSFVSIPLPLSPVPVTAQSFGVMLSGMILGPWWGALSMLVYLGLGCLGFPVFAGGRSGAATLAGPTGGYLLGFVLGSWAAGMIVGALKGRRASAWPYLAASLLGGIVVVHSVGVVWLARSTGRSAYDALMLGSAPFLAGDLLKASGAAAVPTNTAPGH